MLYNYYCLDIIFRDIKDDVIKQQRFTYQSIPLPQESINQLLRIIKKYLNSKDVEVLAIYYTLKTYQSEDF